MSVCIPDDMDDFDVDERLRRHVWESILSHTPQVVVHSTPAEAQNTFERLKMIVSDSALVFSEPPPKDSTITARGFKPGELSFVGKPVRLRGAGKMQMGWNFWLYRLWRGLSPNTRRMLAKQLLGEALEPNAHEKVLNDAVQQAVSQTGIVRKTGTFF